MEATPSERITAYLSSGGLFNPELAIHDAVRDLLIDCRTELAALSAQVEEYRDIGASLYCSTCGSCGIDECCPPGMCWKARYEAAKAQVAELKKQIAQLKSPQ